MSAAHTPGPWMIEVAADGINKWVGCPRYTVATVSQLPNKVNMDEADANARLIAAAPDLLYAVEASRLALHDMLHAKDGREWWKQRDAAMALIDAAIAKATGVQQ